MQAWRVMLNGKEIDTVFFDADIDAFTVKTSLINHDGYDYNIVVVKVRMKK